MPSVIQVFYHFIEVGESGLTLEEISAKSVREYRTCQAVGSRAPFSVSTSGCS